MEHAWLDSLSEDWVSQPGSDTSSGQLPVLKESKESRFQPTSLHRKLSRKTAELRAVYGIDNDNNTSVLSERSTNEIITSRHPSAANLSQNSKGSLPKAVSRSVSASTTASVVHNTVNHQNSPSRDDGDTPEWKRRLIYGDVGYGEQRDLFCSAASGLQDMFKPPPAPIQPATRLPDIDENDEQQDDSLPSSPPLYAHRASSIDLEREVDELDAEEFDYPTDVTPSPSPRRLQRDLKQMLDDDVDMYSPLRAATSAEVPGQDMATPEIYRDQSCLSLPQHDDTSFRKVSGQSDTRNEDFSPIFIERQSDADGRVDYAPLEVPATQLRQKLERLQANQMLFESQQSDEAGQRSIDDAQHPESFDNTEAYARMGGFINLQRGGRSAEDSFRHRALSPSLGVDTSEMFPEESLQASTPKQFPSVRTDLPSLRNHAMSPVLPRAPFPSPEKQRAQQGSHNPVNVSPLKLFGPYDTFTNQTLLRRISQFEEGSSGRMSRESTRGEASPSIAIKGFVAPSSPTKPDGAQQAGSRAASGASSRFGTGELEGFEFQEDFPDFPDRSASSILRGDKENLSPQGPTWPLAQAESSMSTSSPAERSSLNVRRRRSHPVSSASRKPTRQTSSTSLSDHPVLEEPAMSSMPGTPKRDGGSDGKRPRTSPSKDPTPKRRRTLHRSDIAYGREKLMPAAGTPHPKLRVQLGRANLNDALEESSMLYVEEQDLDNGDARSQSIAGIRVFPRRIPDENIAPTAQLDGETGRKPSIRTQDFVDQAAQIMAMIRNQVRPQGLASLEESETENDNSRKDVSDVASQVSTNEPFSRPPSREVKPGSPERKEDDPELMRRLKKYQEMSDMGDIISSSIRSMSLAKDAIRAAQDVERHILSATHSRAGSVEVISDIPNVRISRASDDFGKVTSSTRDYPSNSSGHSTGNTYPTASSRGSDSRRIIVPESVSHLIPDRVGSMHLDKETNTWIKKKETEPAQQVALPPSDDSEDDPFLGIPDLSVDMVKEMRNLRLAASPQRIPSCISERPESADGPGSLMTQAMANLRTLPDDGPESKFDLLAPNLLQSTEDPALNLPAEDDTVGDSMKPEQEDLNRLKASPKRQRHAAISFSSPVASFMHDSAPSDTPASPADGLLPPAAADDDSDDEHQSGAAAKPPKSALRVPSLVKHNVQRSSSRRPSRNEKSFAPRPVSRIDEQDEDSTVDILPDDNRQLSIIGETSLVAHKTPRAQQTSVSFIVNHTPGEAYSFLAEDSAIIGQNVGQLSLSPLSEFTLNNSDQSFGMEVSYVMGRRHMMTGDGSRKVLSMTIRELVDRISEAEPDEAYWEDLTALNLEEKRLASLHTLDEFCGNLVTLDASKNVLTHLEGVPPSIRQLKVSQNMLTELTSWDHLMNLQYLDISGNGLKSLSALRDLVHLRSLKADDNEVESLDGLDGHEGLLSLRARNNLIECLDFTATSFPRLTELDVGGNKISSIEGLETLPVLRTLKIQRNQLQEFELGACSKSLLQLDLSGNELEQLDVSKLPSLHSLNADKNRLSRLIGFRHARRLDSLSLREQRGSELLKLDFLATAYEVRKLFLSGNFLGSFSPGVDLLNLQLLELANCGLHTLPDGLGQLTPNLRSLNLNFNALSDISSLRFIPRMKKLLVAGNRLADSTGVTELLIDFPHLTQLDLRDNPMTLGFYAPAQIIVSTEQGHAVDPFVLPDADAEKDRQFASRLDEGTKLRRRLHQIAFVASCRRLRRLDGLKVQREEVLVQDEILASLIAEGMIPDMSPADGVVHEDDEEKSNVAKKHDTLRSSRWGAEDSFA